MFKKIIKYTDFIGNEHQEEFRFNITETEMLDLIEHDPTFRVDYLKRIMADEDPLKMVDVIRKLIVISYGELSDDGKKFRKNDQITMDFVQSAAYDALYNEMVYGENEELVKGFMLGIFPAKFASGLTDSMGKVAAIPQKN